MNKNKFFEKFLDNLSRLEESKIKQYLESVENERRTFKEVLDHLEEALLVVSRKNIIFMNDEAKRILISPGIKIPITLEDAKKCIFNAEIINFILVSLYDDDYQTEFADAGRDKRYYSIEKITTESEMIIIKIKNITENKKLEIQLKNLESVSALNTLAAGIAHEIKNPLTAIDLHTQIIRKGIQKKIISVPVEVDNYLHIIDEEQKRLAKIVNDFLITARKRELKLSFEDMNDFLLDIIQFIEPEMKELSIDLIDELTTVPKLFFDKDYLRQSIINLLKNAIESVASIPAEHDGLTALRIIKIRTFYENTTDCVGISISDNGPGIDNDKLQKIFEPYYTTKDYGTGLGLTLVYKIIKEHGGEIKVESEKGKGSTFTIYLPLNKGTKLITG